MFLYIDAGTGGVLVQALLGGAAGLAVAARIVWGKLPWIGSRVADRSGDTESPPVGQERSEDAPDQTTR